MSAPTLQNLCIAWRLGENIRKYIGNFCIVTANIVNKGVGQCRLKFTLDYLKSLLRYIIERYFSPSGWSTKPTVCECFRSVPEGCRGWNCSTLGLSVQGQEGNHFSSAWLQGCWVSFRCMLDTICFVWCMYIWQPHPQVLVKKSKKRA